MAAPITEEEALRFIRDQIDSIPHLEALILLSDHPRSWSASEIADRLYIPDERARIVLDDLVERRLLHRKESCYFFDPDQTLKLMMEAVSLLHRNQLVRVTALIHSKASSSVSEFAKAFRFRKGDR
ncbi:MAG: hypothetical protein JNK87_19960 [Bryobacterales bacterium]|nr:hypothetical protein [Bryobacterales bacterium]